MKHLFLDLEDTIITPVIEGWFEVELINAPEIKRFIEEGNFDSFGIFTYAIHNKNDMDQFSKLIKPAIEKALQINFGFIFTVDTVLDSLRKFKRIAGAEFNDVFDWFHKDDGFRLIIEHNFQSGDFTLIDDTVRNTTLTIQERDKNLTIKTVNVNRI